MLRGSIARKLRENAEKNQLTPEEYILYLMTSGLDPREGSKEYVEAAQDLLAQARAELGKGDVRQAAEKAWGAAALAVKAYAMWREGRRLASHGELWRYTEVLVKELGEWVSDAWAQAAAMHVCFYEGWCTPRHVEEALKRIERLVGGVAAEVLGGKR